MTARDLAAAVLTAAGVIAGTAGLGLIAGLGAALLGLGVTVTALGLLLGQAAPPTPADPDLTVMV